MDFDQPSPEVTFTDQQSEDNLGPSEKVYFGGDDCDLSQSNRTLGLVIAAVILVPLILVLLYYVF